MSGANAITTVASILAGTSETVDITFTIDTDFQGTSITNWTEISDDNAEDYGTTDKDSTPDDDNSDTFSGDNNIDEDGTM